MRNRSLALAVLTLVFLMGSESVFAASSDLTLLTSQDNGDGEASYSVSLQVLIFMTMLSMLPAALMAMTSFTRIVIVLAILRQALGMMQTPSNQIIVGIALFTTFFIMSPVFEVAYSEGLQPYMEDSIGMDDALTRTGSPFHEFMRSQVRETDVALFAQMAGTQIEFASPEEIPFRILVPAYITSELKTAFQIGFLIFIPFLVIDLVVSSILMSMGMLMLSPMLISLPFKIMLFVLVDGWTLIIGTLVSSFVPS